MLFGFPFFFLWSFLEWRKTWPQNEGFWKYVYGRTHHFTGRNISMNISVNVNTQTIKFDWKCDSLLTALLCLKQVNALLSFYSYFLEYK